MKQNLTILFLLTTRSLLAQKNKAPKAKAPAKKEKPKNWDLNFTTDEGTWLIKIIEAQPCR